VVVMSVLERERAHAWIEIRGLCSCMHMCVHACRCDGGEGGGEGCVQVHRDATKLSSLSLLVLMSEGEGKHGSPHACRDEGGGNVSLCCGEEERVWGRGYACDTCTL
jgi:hypothetical protein